ncbi:MAG: hypothetical protein MUC49_20550 [Raineya sp.]|jgi:hypothetical protein|nr:hypothetical protein [Raineya sp.]
MNFNFPSEQEKKEFLALSDMFVKNQYEEALPLAYDMLEKYSHNKHIYHNQVGALEYLVNADYHCATEHYVAALENGFPKEPCEENIWESAIAFYNVLKKENGGFNAIFFEDGNIIYAINLLEVYQKHFPNGKYAEEALKLIQDYKDTK